MVGGTPAIGEHLGRRRAWPTIPPLCTLPRGLAPGDLTLLLVLCVAGAAVHLVRTRIRSHARECFATSASRPYDQGAGVLNILETRPAWPM